MYSATGAGAGPECTAGTLATNAGAGAMYSTTGAEAAIRSKRDVLHHWRGCYGHGRDWCDVFQHQCELNLSITGVLLRRRASAMRTTAGVGAAVTAWPTRGVRAAHTATLAQ